MAFKDLAKESIILAALAILALGFLSEAISFGVAMRTLMVRAREKGIPLRDALRQAGDPVLVAIIAEDSAGLAGAIQIAGLTLRLYQQISPGYGFTGIAVALLANNNPIGVIFSGLLSGALRSGSEVMQISAKIPSVMVLIIQGLIILSVVTFGVYQAKWAKRRQV